MIYEQSSLQLLCNIRKKFVAIASQYTKKVRGNFYTIYECIIIYENLQIFRYCIIYKKIPYEKKCSTWNKNITFE